MMYKLASSGMENKNSQKTQKVTSVLSWHKKQVTITA